MGKRIAHIALVVREYDEAINFFIKKLDFHLIEDTQLSATQRWVLVGSEGREGFSLLFGQGSKCRTGKCFHNVAIAPLAYSAGTMNDSEHKIKRH